MCTMFGKKWIISVLAMSMIMPATAQKIIYSDPDKDDTRRLNFEIVGKITRLCAG